MTENPPTPEEKICNIFVFHGAVDLPSVKPSHIEAELSPQQLPDGFDYYAAGHVHERYMTKFKAGILAYSGCTETADYQEAQYPKGFLQVRVNEKGKVDIQEIEAIFESQVRHLRAGLFRMPSGKITELATQLVSKADVQEAIIIPVLRELFLQKQA